MNRFQITFNFILSCMLGLMVSPAPSAAQVISDLSDQSIRQVINTNLEDKKIVFFAENHKSETSFEKVGAQFLKELRSVGFDCLMVEFGKNNYQKSFDAFLRGQSYETSIDRQRIKLYGSIGAKFMPNVDERRLFEIARELGYKIHAIDTDVRAEDLKRFMQIQNNSNRKIYFENEMARNVQMAQEIAWSLDSAECKRVISVNGASHINPIDMKDYSSRTLTSIPEILAYAGMSSVAFRLQVNKGKDNNTKVYNTIFLKNTDDSEKMN